MRTFLILLALIGFSATTGCGERAADPVAPPATDPAADPATPATTE